MKRDFKFYLKLFTSTFSLSAFTFGGGYVIVPLMRKKFVDQYKWIDEKEMLDLICIAQSSPGAIAVNSAILIGYRLAGFGGALITILGTVLPPFITLSIISTAYSVFRDSLIVQHVLRGMQAGVAAVIVDVVITMFSDVKKEGKILPYFIMAGAFLTSYYLNINVIFIILTCAGIGVISMYIVRKKEMRRKQR